jgi:tRNA(His) 5'-end guanylyltransferase
MESKYENGGMGGREMPVRDDLGVRMKTFYEQIPKTKLMRRTPVAIRIDGKAFHTFTRGFDKPFDMVLIRTMQRTTKYLCENIQGCVFGYTQSDEITLILVDYKKLTSSAWFDYEVQKMCSIAASMATMAFNRFFVEEVSNWRKQALPANFMGQGSEAPDERIMNLLTIYGKAIEKGAMFDARCFNIPKEEVTNLVYWRQVDAARNSVQMVGQANFSHAELQDKTCNMIQDMLHEQRGINWNDYPVMCKRGTAIIKKTTENGRTEWFIDTEMPILKSEDRAYVDSLVYVGE